MDKSTSRRYTQVHQAVMDARNERGGSQLRIHPDDWEALAKVWHEAEHTLDDAEFDPKQWLDEPFLGMAVTLDNTIPVGKPQVT